MQPPAAPAPAPAPAPACACGLPVDARAPRFLLECHYCGRWLHGDCAGVGEREALAIAKFACAPCAKRGHATVRFQYDAAGGAADEDELGFAPLPIQRRSAEYATGALHHHHHQHQHQQPAAYSKSSDAFRRVLRTAIYARSGVRSVLAQEMGPAYFKAHALDQPVLVLDSSGSSSSANGLPAVSAHDVSRLLDMPTGSAIASVDVEAQTAATLTARSWAEKLRASYDEAGHGGPTSDASSSPLNAIFRVRGTPFAQRVAAPEAVAAVDWRYSLSSHYQQMQEADVVGCYLGLNAFLDFQIAPGGRSSWISVSSGELWVFMVPPTAAHLRTFQQWKLTPPSASSAANALPPSRIFLPELVEKCIKCVVSSGASIIVPAGYAIALFAAQSDDCSFFSGLFSATSAIDKQLQVVLDLEMQSTRQQQQQPSTAIATSIWSIALDAPDTDIRVVDSQISTAVKQYSQQLSVPNMAISISDQDKLALRRALPFLRRWSTSSTASSPSEAQEAVSQLEQALTMASPSPMHSQFGHSYGNMLMDRGLQPGFGNTMHASVDGVATPTKSANTSLPSLSPTEANYIYAAAGAADDWLASEATGMGGSLNMGMGTGGGMESFADPVGYHNPIQSVWGEYNAHQQFTAPPAPGLDQNRLISSQGSDGSNFFPSMGGFNSAASTPLVPTSDGLFVSLGSSYSSGPSSVNNPSSYFGDQFSAGSVSSQISATAMALGIGTRPTSSTDVDALVRHRASCHRCGNLRKKNVRCPTCPHIFCQKCAEKMVEEHGEEIFSGGCPVCKERCCCGKNRSATCTRKYHCYKKCPSTKRTSA